METVLREDDTGGGRGHSSRTLTFCKGHDMARRDEKPANIRAVVVTVSGVVALGTALLAASAAMPVLVGVAVVCVLGCTAWLAWDGWRRWKDERAARAAGESR